MGNCSGRLRNPDVPEDIVDLNKIIQDLARERISVRRLTYAEKLCLEKSIKFEVGWNYVDFTHLLTKFTPSKRNIPGQYRNIQLFRTKFVNSTDMQQEYTFRTERQTKSTCSISVQRGYTIGGTLNLEFALPTPDHPVTADVTPCKISGGLSAQMLWSKTQGEVHEETLTWSVDSLVKVNKKQTAWAALVVHEENIDVEFEVESTLISKLENNKIPVMVRRTKDNTLLQVIEVPCKEIGTWKKRKNFHYDKEQPGMVKFTTQGGCKAVYATEQVIQIETRPLWLSDDISASVRALNLDAKESSTLNAASVVIEDVTDEKSRLHIGGS